MSTQPKERKESVKHFIAAVLLLVALTVATVMAPAQAATLYVMEDKDARLEMTDERCLPSIADQYILTEFQSMFRSYKIIPKSPDMKRQFQGKSVVYGCYSDNEEIAPKGVFVYVNEFGNMGYVPVEEFEPTEKGVRI